MSILKWFASLVLAATAVSASTAETHCPGNVASLPYRHINRNQMIIPVTINHSGPFDFLLDTGTQMTMIDPLLADELHLSRQGEAAVASAGLTGSASFAQLDSTELGGHALASMRVLVYDLRNLQATGLDIRGVLGEDFLEHFDMLIDNAHQQVCLDDTGAMGSQVKGQHVPLLTWAPADDGTLAKSLIVSARLSDGMRPVRLKLDSGTNVSFLYNTSEYMALGTFRGASLQGGANGGRRTFSALPPQNMKIGGVELSRVPFVTLMGVQKDSRTSGFDGLLSMGLFRRVFINHAEHFAVLDPM
jgi:hypothetical protein